MKMKYLNNYKLYEYFIPDSTDNSNVIEMVKDILLDLNDIGFNVHVGISELKRYYRININIGSPTKLYNYSILKPYIQHLISYLTREKKWFGMQCTNILQPNCMQKAYIPNRFNSTEYITSPDRLKDDYQIGKLELRFDKLK